MKITLEDSEKMIKSPHLLHLTSVNWSVLQIRSYFHTVHKGQNSVDDNLCKSDVQVDIC